MNETLQQRIDELRSQIVALGDRSPSDKQALVTELRALVEQLVELNRMPQRVELHSQLEMLLGNWWICHKV